MLNAERFKEEILKNSNVVFDFSMSKDKHTIKKCLGTCDDCFFHEVGDHCSNIKVKWLLSDCCASLSAHNWSIYPISSLLLYAFSVQRRT